MRHITQSCRHIQTITRSYVDVKNKFSGKLEFIRIDIANLAVQPNQMRWQLIDAVYEHHQVILTEHRI